ncbi:MAG: hypothetical protein LW688_10555 [Cryomorphaceae bacterium]|nr:hypothetical protein [Cryomorphaceae bacterium]
MKKILRLLFVLVFSSQSFAQTKGMIVVPASSGTAVLDPNGDGYVSTNNAGFISNDILESEIPFVTLIPAGNEPAADIENAPNCGFTDFVESVSGGLDPAMHYYDASGNWLFRLRMGNISPNSKSYSILIDSDNLIGPADVATFNASNPGFEFEIVLATNFGITIYDHSTGLDCTPTYSSIGDANYQKSIANSEVCGQLNYFMDFFVTAADIAAMGINPNTTTLRYALVDNTAANKSTLCNPSSASDVGAVDGTQCTNLLACLTSIVEQQSGCTLAQISTVPSPCPAVSICPSMNTLSLTVGSTTVTGSSTEPVGTVIRVFSNGVEIGTTTVLAGQTWSATVSPALSAGATITATAQYSSELESPSACNSFTIPNCPGAPAAAPVITNETGKNLCGTGIPGYNVQVYYQTGTIFPANPAVSAYLPVAAGGNWTWKCTGNTGDCNAGSGVDCISEGGYMVIQVSPEGCPSLPAFACVSIGGGYSPNATSPTPTITASSVVSGGTSISGTVSFNAAPAPQGGYLYLFMDGEYFSTSSYISASGAYTISCPALPACGSLTVRFVQSGSTAPSDHDCFSAASTAVIIGGPSDAPTVDGPLCSAVNITSVSGTSTEEDGTVIQVFENGVAEGSTTTVSNGSWTASTGISIAPGAVITATALNSSGCESESAPSAGVTVGIQTAGTATIIPIEITEGATSVSGTGVAGATVGLLIDSYPVFTDAAQTTLATATVDGSGNWTISGIYSGELYAGGTLEVTMTSGAGCPTSPQDPTPVICIPPNITLTINPDDVGICSGSSTVAVTIPSSQTGVIYQLYNQNTSTNSGSSILGNASSITLTSALLSSNTTLEVLAIRFPIGQCTSTMNETIAFTIGAPAAPTATVTTQPSCAVPTGTITVTAPTGSNYEYSIDGVTYQAGTAFSSLAPGSYNVRAFY